MSKNNTGGAAFPIPKGRYLGAAEKNGMTLRDYFAAKAMQSLMIKSPFTNHKNYEEAKPYYEYISRSAYGYADAMIEERGK